MAEFWTICLLSIGMFIGCGLAGWIPLAFTLSQRKIQLFTIFGAGLLVGTALAVIIPEGVQTMYNTSPVEMISTQLGFAKLEQPEGGLSVGGGILGQHTHTHAGGAHHAIGVSLLLGFVFMLLVDQFGGSAHSHPTEIRLGESQQPDQRSKGHTATIGLVVHAAADGVAMGAAASTDRSDLQFIVFLAIMLHKAPAAFGLVSFLVHEGLEPRKVKRHLLAFALAAPLLAIVTFVFLNQVGLNVVVKDKQMLQDYNATGVAMLFSAGTFLYVATVHVLPEVAQSASGPGKLGLCEVLVLVLGSLFPLILNLSHTH
uniref:Zinc transporter ZIP9 n=1 Tax=Ciona savignyi TaxID=51511 RepID=H2YYJ6_CIOSA